MMRLTHRSAVGWALSLAVAGLLVACSATDDVGPGEADGGANGEGAGAAGGGDANAQGGAGALHAGAAGAAFGGNGDGGTDLGGAGAGGEIFVSPGGAPSLVGDCPLVSAGDANEGGAGGDASSSTIELLEGLCHRLVAKEQLARITCGTPPPPGWARGALDACLYYANASVRPAMDDGLLVYDAQQADLCLSADVELFCATGSFEPVPGCKNIFTGTVEGTDPCSRVWFFNAVVETCADGWCDAGTALNCGDGVCMPYAAVGEPCSPVLPCAPGTLCDTATQQCVASKGLHEACSSPGSVCNVVAPIYRCLPRADGEAGFECDVHPRPVGAVCGAGGTEHDSACEFKCRGGVCVDHDELGNQYCHAHADCPTPQVCLDEICQAPLGRGDECRINSGTCAQGLFCLLTDASSAANGECRRPSREGDACYDSDGCSPGFQCEPVAKDAGECHALPQAEHCYGEGAPACPCGTQCLRETGACEQALGLGDACTYSEDCSGGLVCDSDTDTCIRAEPDLAACDGP